MHAGEERDVKINGNDNDNGVRFLFIYLFWFLWAVDMETNRPRQGCKWRGAVVVVAAAAAVVAVVVLLPSERRRVAQCNETEEQRGRKRGSLF